MSKVIFLSQHFESISISFRYFSSLQVEKKCIYFQAAVLAELHYSLTSEPTVTGEGVIFYLLLLIKIQYSMYSMIIHYDVYHTDEGISLFMGGIGAKLLIMY